MDVQPIFFSYAFAYEKRGDAVFFSHLDTVRALERGIRRSGVSVQYTKGCNPHIKLSAYSAVPLGVETNGEWVSFRLIEDLDPEPLRTRINEHLPRGLNIVHFRRGSPPLLEEDWFALQFHFSGSLEEKARATMQGFYDQERIEVQGTRKGRPYIHDIRPFIDDLNVLQDVIVIKLMTVGKKVRVADLTRKITKILGANGILTERVEIVHGGLGFS